MSEKRILETERLLLREFDEEDVEAFYTLGSDPVIIKYTGDGGLTDVEHARQILRSRPMADYRKHGFGRWACVWKPSEEVIGFAGLKHLDDLGEVDIGYRLLPAYWGVGLATEASRAILTYGFVELKLARIIGLVDPKNGASVRVLEKIGLVFEKMIDFRGAGAAKYGLDAKDAG